jgi:hypothetical protein
MFARAYEQQYLTPPLSAPSASKASSRSTPSSGPDHQQPRHQARRVLLLLLRYSDQRQARNCTQWKSRTAAPKDCVSAVTTSSRWATRIRSQDPTRAACEEECLSISELPSLPHQFKLLGTTGRDVPP